MAKSEVVCKPIVSYKLFDLMRRRTPCLVRQLVGALLISLSFESTVLADVVYRQNFDNAPLGTYIKSTTTIVGGSEAKSGRSLRVIYPKGKYGLNGSGAQWLVKLPKIYNELYLAYWIKFQSGFEFVKGGKVPGLAGGPNLSGGCGAYLTPDGTNAWSARGMWYAKGKAVQYVYYPEYTGRCGCNMDYSLGGYQRYFKPGVWHRVVHRIKMNTLGKKDGIIQAWFDGVMALDRRSIRFRDVSTLGINLFAFSTYMGGNDSTWAPSKNQYSYFDDFVVSTTPIK